jgi:hypothetical protein
MLDAKITFPSRVGTAPGTTTMQIASFRGRGLGQAFPYVNQPSPTQAVYEPDPRIDNVRIALPPNQWVTGPASVKLSIPAVQSTFGPVPNDRQLALTRPYLPLHKGWIETNGETVYTIQGSGLGQTTAEERAFRWSIAASVISAVALATTTALAIIRFRQGR